MSNLTDDTAKFIEALNTRDSISEQHGLELMKETDIVVFCPGISTAGFAEMKMARLNESRRIIATTIDPKVLSVANETILKYRLADQIDARLQDLRDPNNYENASFDFIYARLVLHYLPAQELELVLAEFFRIMKPGAKLFVVVRSLKNIEDEEVQFDESTHLSTVTYYNPDGSMRYRETRYFHSSQSISSHLTNSGFDIINLQEFSEQLYVDFRRTTPADKLDQLIEVVAIKPTES